MTAVERRKSVALLIETSNRYGRELLYGVRSFLQESFSWTIRLTEHGRGDLPPAWLSNWTGDGMIARIETPRIAKAVRAAGVPVVNVSATSLAPEFASFVTDSAAAARLAAEHLLERGLPHFGYCGDDRFEWSQTHGRNFAAHVRAAGRSCSMFSTSARNAQNPAQQFDALAAWVRCLPKPVGIMACYDIRGQQLLDVCRQEQLAVPDQVAVIGLHNDELLCDLCEPPLSSVIPNARRTGYEAAQLLDRLMRGRAKPGVRTIEPLGVATRKSTDMIALEDPGLAAAARFIREHACDGVNVDDVVRAAGISRSALERGFQTHLGRTPHDQILRAKLARVRQMLADTDLSLREIAERTGFSYPEYLSTAFKKHVGASPTDYRRTVRG